MIDIAWLNQRLADPDRDRCGEALNELLKFFRSSRVLTGLRKDVIDDLVQEAVLSTWQFVKNGRTIPSANYLHKILRNKGMDHFRRLKRQASVVDDVKIVQSPSGSLDAEDLSIDEVQTAFDKLLERAVDDRKPALQQKLRNDCMEVWNLAVGELTMTAAIDAELARSGSPVSFVVARDRLQQRHKRARDSLESALENLVVDGQIPIDQRGFYEMLLRKLLRRQNSRPEASTKQA